MICLSLGTGSGGGLIFDGKIYHGNKYGAGEVVYIVGYIIVNKDGPTFNYGGYGCLETYSSALILLKLNEGMSGHKTQQEMIGLVLG